MARSRLLLVVHGRAGGLIPEELTSLAAELGERRDAPVRLQALTAAAPPVFPPSGSAAPLTLVPLFLLPGAHVRHDVPAIAAHWRRWGPVRRLPFLGAWPLWQRALADEVAEAVGRTKAKGVAEDSTPSGRAIEARPRLLHHPLEGALAARFLAHLQAITQAECHATPYSSTNPEESILAISGPVLPLALAANRLTESLGERLGAPLLARARCRRVVLQRLEALP
jgi:sirohydrochlorin ferrochelatase